MHLRSCALVAAAAVMAITVFVLVGSPVLAAETQGPASPPRPPAFAPLPDDLDVLAPPAKPVHERLTVPVVGAPASAGVAALETETATGVDAEAAEAAAAEAELQASLTQRMEDIVSLLFRSLDRDHDSKITESDVEAFGDEQMGEHLPGMTRADFVEFMRGIDVDGDGALSHAELADGMWAGAENAGFVETTAVLESGARAGQRRQRRFIKWVGEKIKQGVNAVKNFLGFGDEQKDSDGVDNTQEDECVICQYIVERMEANVNNAGAVTRYAESAQAAATDGGAMRGNVLLEVAATTGVEAQQSPVEAAERDLIYSTRAATAMQRQLERQKYNEIYRIVDITLDDVCEQGMPESFYRYCTNLYKVQGDVVDGLRYQYRATDICRRINMCTDKSYIAQGVHSKFGARAGGGSGGASKSGSGLLGGVLISGWI